MFTDKTHSYGTLSKLFHWLTAILVAWQFAKFLDRVGGGEHWIADNIVSHHISIGSIFLLLVIVRTIWALAQRGKRPVNPQASNKLVAFGHAFLYVLMILMPLLGVAVMVGNGYGLGVYGWQIIERGGEIPFLIQLGSFHSPVAWLFLIVVLGHIAMAVKHHVTNDKKVMRSML